MLDLIYFFYSNIGDWGFFFYLVNMFGLKYFRRKKKWEKVRVLWEEEKV